MKRIDWKSIGDFVGHVGEIALYGIAVVASYKIGDYVINNELGSETVGYEDAVKAIMASDMYSHDKRDAIEALNRHETADYYGAIVHIAKDSSMFSHDKVKMIKNLS